VAHDELLAEIRGLFESSICGDVGGTRSALSDVSIGNGYVDATVGGFKFRITAQLVK
jgi:hypothetical protein